MARKSKKSAKLAKRAKKVSAYKESEILEQRRRAFLEDAAKEFGPAAVVEEMHDVALHTPRSHQEIEADLMWLNKNPDAWNASTNASKGWYAGTLGDGQIEVKYTSKPLNQPWVFARGPFKTKGEADAVAQSHEHDEVILPRRNPNEICDCFNLASECDCAPTCECQCNANLQHNPSGHCYDENCHLDVGGSCNCACGACGGFAQNPAKWSGSVKTKWHPPAGLFASGSAERIASTVLKGHHGDAGKSAQSISFYLNRAGENLSPERRKTIKKALGLVRNNPGGISRGYANSLNWGGPLYRNPDEEHPVMPAPPVAPQTNPGGISRGYANSKNWGGPLYRNPNGISRGYANSKNWGGPLYRNPDGISRGYANAKNWGGPLFRNPFDTGVSQGYASAKNWGGPLFRNPEEEHAAAPPVAPPTAPIAPALPAQTNPGGISRGYANSKNWGGPLYRNPNGISRGYANSKNWGGPLYRNPDGISRSYANAKNWGGPLFRNPACTHCAGRGLVFDGVCPMCHGAGSVASNPDGISRGYANAKNWGGPLYRNPDGISRGYANAKNWGGPLYRNPDGISRGYANAKNWGGPLFRNPEDQVWGPKLHDPLEENTPFDKNPGDGLFKSIYSRNPQEEEELDLDDLL